MDRAVIYCRVSSAEQVGNLSLPTQERLCREYCAKNGWEVAKVFIEPGESAKTADRPVFQEALTFCRQKKNVVGYMVVHSLSRFCRNTEDHVIVAAMLRKCGVKLRSVTEPIDDSSIGKFMETVLAGFAELDNRMKADRSIVGMKDSLDLGRWPFRAPIGYLNGRDAADNPVITVDQERAPLVRQAFERFSTGLLTKSQVLDELHAQGLRTLKGGKISPQMFAYMMRNRFYTGLQRVDSWGEWRLGGFPALVDQETFDKVQAILAGRRPKITPNKCNRPDFPLRGFIRCGHCGALMTGSSSTGRSKSYPYYRCWKKCAGISVRAEKIEGQFLELLKSLQMKPEFVALFSEIVLDIWHSKQAHTRELAAGRQRQIAELEKRRQRLVDAFVYKQAIDQKMFQDQLDKLEAEIGSLRIDADDGQADDLEIKAALQFAQRVLANPVEFWQAAPLDQKQRFQRVLCPSGIVVTAEGISQPAVTSPVFKLLQPNCAENGNLESLIISTWNQIVDLLRQLERLGDDVPLAA